MTIQLPDGRHIDILGPATYDMLLTFIARADILDDTTLHWLKCRITELEIQARNDLDVDLASGLDKRNPAVQTAGARLTLLISAKDFIQKVLEENFQTKIMGR